MTWKFIEIWSSTYRRNSHVESTGIRRGVPVGILSLLVFLKFQPNVCHRCHDFLMMSINISDISILNIKGSDYCCVINLISKNGAIKFIQNGDLTKKAEHHETYTKMCKEILTFGNIEIEKR